MTTTIHIGDCRETLRGLGRDAILCELNPEYASMAAARIRDDAPMFNEVEVR